VVVDTANNSIAGTISDLKGVHGIAVAPELNKGFISNGQGNNVTVFDLKTLAKTGEAATGQNPDAICYEPKTKRVFTFNGRSNDSTAIDANTNQVVATVKLGGRPENCAVDGAGKVYDNLEDTSELLEIDAAKPDVTRRVSLKPCESPSGAAIDVKDSVVFSVCDGKVMAITDVKAMKMIGTASIGDGPDAAGFDPATGIAFSSNGEGTLTLVKKVGGKWTTVDTVKTEPRARTMAVDEVTHKVYLPSADFQMPPASAETPKKGGRGPRPQMVPDTFRVIVVGKS